MFSTRIATASGPGEPPRGRHGDPLKCRSSLYNAPMATQFVLSCDCGREIPVEAGQAGDQVHCECGNAIQVPKLGQLRLLPRIQSAESASTWSPRKGLLTLGGLVAAVSLVIGIYFWAVTPSRTDLDISGEKEYAGGYVDALSPTDTWIYWQQLKTHLAAHGFEEEDSPRLAALDEAIERSKTNQAFAFGVAGLAILFCIALALWSPAKRPS